MMIEGVSCMAHCWEFAWRRNRLAVLDRDIADLNNKVANSKEIFLKETLTPMPEGLVS